MTTTDDIPNYPFDKPAPLEPPTEWAHLRDTCPVAVDAQRRRGQPDQPLLRRARRADRRQVQPEPERPPASRDSAPFPDPDRFDPYRSNAGHHLAFGAGSRFCLGQPLGRTMLQVTLGTMTRKLPTLRLRDGANTLPMRTGMVVGGFENVWVTW
jgi:hypothetical protein